MSLATLMFGTAAQYRRFPVKDSANAQTLSGTALVAAKVPVNVQPAAARERQDYMTRSLEISHTVFTTKTGNWERNDVLAFKGRYLQVVGFRNLIELNRVLAVDCLEYDGADLRGVDP